MGQAACHTSCLASNEPLRIGMSRNSLGSTCMPSLQPPPDCQRTCLPDRGPSATRRDRRRQLDVLSCWYTARPTLIPPPTNCIARPEAVSSCLQPAEQPNPTMAALTVCSAAACKAQTVRASAQQPKVGATSPASRRPRPGELQQCRCAAGAPAPPYAAAGCQPAPTQTI